MSSFSEDSTGEDLTPPVAPLLQRFLAESDVLLQELAQGLTGMALHRVCVSLARTQDDLLLALAALTPSAVPWEARTAHLDLLDSFVYRVQQLLEVDDERVRIKTAHSLRFLCREDLLLFSHTLESAQESGSHTHTHTDTRTDTHTESDTHALSHTHTEERESSFPVLSFVAHALLAEIARNHERRQMVRPTTLGDASLISMDDTTGWRFLESYTCAYQSLLIGLAQWESREAEKEFCALLSLSVSLSGSDGDSDNNNINDKDTVTAFSLVLKESMQHTSRHLRERAHGFLCDLFKGATRSLLCSLVTHTFSHTHSNASVTDTDSEGETLFSAALAGAVRGLDDDWSQVRNAATQALDALLSTTLTPHTHNDAHSGTSQKDDVLAAHMHALLDRTYWSALVPRLCLNRFHAATSLQTLSLSLWQRVLGPQGRGRRLLAQHQESVLLYYATQARNVNHMVSEAALQAIGEYVRKIALSVSFSERVVKDAHVNEETQYIAPLYAPLSHTVFGAVAAALGDDRWPVKDSGCIASGALWRHCESVLESERETVEREIELFISLWHDCLNDCIWSVRDNAAIALGDALASPIPVVRERCLEFVLRQIRGHLLTALPATKATHAPRGFSFLPPEMVQAAEEKKSHAMTAPSQTYSATKPFTQAEAQAQALALMPAVQSDTQQVKRKGWGCCIDCVDLRAIAPWEVSQSAVFLLRELSRTNSTVLATLCKKEEGVFTEDEVQISILQATLLLLERDDYDQFDKLHATLYQELPFVLQSLFASDEECVVTEREKALEKLRAAIRRDAALEDPPAPPTTAKRVLRNRSVNEARRIVAKECEPRLREMIGQ